MNDAWKIQQKRDADRDANAFEAELYRPIAETEQAADLWLALALRKLARDRDVFIPAGRKVDDQYGTSARSGSVVVHDVLNAVADVLEGA